MLVVAESTVPKEVIGLVGSEVLEGVGSVWNVTAADIRRRSGCVSAEREERVVVDSRRLELGTTVDGGGQVKLQRGFAGQAVRRRVEWRERIGEGNRR